MLHHTVGAQESIIRILPASTSRLPQGNLPADGQVLVSLQTFTDMHDIEHYTAMIMLVYNCDDY